MSSKEVKENEKGKKKKKRRPLNLILIIAALAVMAFSLYKLYGIYHDYNESEATFEALEDAYVTNPDDGDGDEENTTWNENTQIEFEALRQENEDIIAWLRFDNFDDVHISYPVLYSGDDSTYLRSDIYGNYHIAGCIFLEGLNNPDFTDYHSIIYGHNMRNTTMFGDLKRYKNDEGFYENNQYFNVYTETKMYRYHIFSYYDVDENDSVYTVGYAPDEEWQTMIDKMVSSSYKDTGIHPTNNDKIVTLSTCSKAGENLRFVVHGVLVEEYDVKK